jgi:Outer membrane protein beta-barrel domain
MKLIYAIGLLAFFSVNAFSQEYARFSVGIGAGYVPVHHDYAGFSFYIEPSYRIAPKFSLGLRIESMARPSPSYANNLKDIDLMGSYTLNGKYYFLSSGRLQFFAGLGAGLYLPLGGPFGNCSCNNQFVDEKKFGAYPRVGFEYGHLAITLDFNLVQSAKQKTYTDNLTYPPFSYSTTYQASTNYISLKAGVKIGRKRRKL